jgi:hypothetical protein
MQVLAQRVVSSKGEVSRLYGAGDADGRQRGRSRAATTERGAPSGVWVGAGSSCGLGQRWARCANVCRRGGALAVDTGISSGLDGHWRLRRQRARRRAPLPRRLAWMRGSRVGWTVIGALRQRAPTARRAPVVQSKSVFSLGGLFLLFQKPRVACRRATPWARLWNAFGAQMERPQQIQCTPFVKSEVCHRCPAGCRPVQAGSLCSPPAPLLHG